jgi:hypothetical protein
MADSTAATQPAAEAKTEVKSAVGADVIRLAEFVSATTVDHVARETLVNKWLINGIARKEDETSSKKKCGLVQLVWDRLKVRHALADDACEIKFDVCAQQQYILLVRMIAVTAAKYKFDLDGNPFTNKQLTQPGIDRDLWIWLENIVKRQGPDEWEILKDSAVTDEINAVREHYDEEDKSNEIAHELVSVVIFLMTEAIVELLADLSGPSIDCVSPMKKAITINDERFNGALRLLNKGRLQIGMELFVSIFRCAEQLPEAKKLWTPPKEPKVTKATKTTKPKTTKAPK